MRHLAMTGMVTASWISWILSGSDMRATPPSRRMSAGTRSSAMTAHAPASSAIFACSASTTSMITPPLSISARPLLTRIVPYSAIGVSVARSELIEERPMEPWSREPVGRFDELEIESETLRDNPLGDPHVRPLWVYVPPAYDAEPDRRFPSIYLIQGMTGQLDMWRNRTAFRPSTPERIDRLFAEEDCPPALVVAVDAWTSYGGSQFIDSPGTGRYGEYLCDEVVSFVDSHYRTLAEAAHRGLTGKSSGGYGAMVVPMLRPDVFGGLATHSGDALFEVCYLPEFREVVRALRDHYDGSFERFWADFRSRPAMAKRSDHLLLNAWCMAACYSTDEDGTVHLPFDTATGELVPEVWERWLAW